MANPRSDGAALLVAGHGAPSSASALGHAIDASAVHTLGQIGEALLATGDAWHIRRLTAAAADRYAADRATLKRAIDDLVAEPVRALVLVLLGSIVDTGEGPALMTGADARAYPEDATLPLSWIRRRLLAARAELVVVALSANGDGSPAEWLFALGTERPGHFVAIDAPQYGHAMVDALLTGLCGDAVDPRTGTVTMASLCEHVCVRASIAQRTEQHDTFAQPPPLAGLWDVRRSQLANRKRPPTEASEDLTGSVLPGRFRIDEMVARGTFGTVYRARQLAVERDVAIKVLHADIDPSSEDGRLFVHEIRSVGRIDHTNVVRIHQADITPDGRLFFAMELLDGRDLQQVGADGPLPQARAIELVRQLLAGLGAAHDAGLVHADVKPANAIVLERNRRAGSPKTRTFDDVPTERHVDSAARGDRDGARRGADGRDGDGARRGADGRDGARREAGPDGGERHARSSSPPIARAVPAGEPAPAEVVEPSPSDRVVLVDFGLARLRAADRPAESAGGTPAYMAPEQLHEGRVDARSDLYSAALVLVFLLTGWRRPNAFTLAPPLDGIADADLRRVLARALDKDPEKRYPTARALAAALPGGAENAPALRESQPILVALPFRHLAALTEADRGRLYGRENDLAILTEHALYRRSVIYTAPSGIGKTSLLRAGLRPRLEALGVESVYLRCRGNFAAALANAVTPGEDSIEKAIAAWYARSQEGERRARKLVIILDQLETTLADADFVPSVLAFDRWPAGADVAVVLSIREDFLARLVARTQELEPGMPIVRLPPLSPAGARAAITNPLAQSRMGIEPELLDALLDDLQKAATAIGPEMGWGAQRVVFPPHLQLACSVLYEALAPGEATITLAHYRQLGGFEAIVGEHLDRVIETELADGRDQIARGIFVALVTAHHERAMRPESELIEVAAAGHDAHEVTAVLEILRSRGLLVRVRSEGNEPGWELVHDSLIPRVLSWVDRRDLARRRAMEVVRYHVRRSRAEAPSHLNRAELRELRGHPSALPELDAEWSKRSPDSPADAWTPSRLVARSEQVLRRRVAVLATTLSAAFALASVGMYGRHVAGQRAREQEQRAEAAERDKREAAAEADRLQREREALHDKDLGRLVLAIEGFDLDASFAVKPVALTGVSWELRQPDRNDPDSPGEPFAKNWVVHGTQRREGIALVEELETHGGAAFLIVTRGACASSVVPLRQLPGFASRHLTPETYRIAVPTCAASATGMARVPEGPFTYRGLGEPPALILEKHEQFARAQTVVLPAFEIDRTEVTNAAFATLAKLSKMTDIKAPRYPDSSANQDAGKPHKPVSYIDWREARAFCRFHGKELPSAMQWVKALRGGELLPDGARNTLPSRNLPWGKPIEPVPAHIDANGPADVGTHPGDTSVYGVLDLGGNVMEWTDSPAETSGHRVIKGANYFEAKASDLVNWLAIENFRDERARELVLGFRCVAK